MRCSFVVLGLPAPQGSKRFVGVSASGKGLMVEASKKVAPWREVVHTTAQLIRARDGLRAPMDGPLRARIVFTLPKPVAASKKRPAWPLRSPDLDKLCRSTLDALTTSGLIADDARIVEFARLAKVYPGEDPEALSSPGARIEVELIDLSWR
ncbi:MAG: Xanthomonas citri phage [Pseudomonadota bacterium]|jgi:Holliday junction resolvase RusA-like endonuclease